MATAVLDAMMVFAITSKTNVNASLQPPGSDISHNQILVSKPHIVYAKLKEIRANETMILCIDILHVAI